MLILINLTIRVALGVFNVFTTLLTQLALLYINIIYAVMLSVEHSGVSLTEVNIYIFILVSENKTEFPAVGEDCVFARVCVRFCLFV